MSYGIRRDFYQSKAWKDCKKEVWLKQNLLCGICGRPVYVNGLSNYLPKDQRVTGIVHHKEQLNDTNIYDDNVTLNINNLIGVCKDCHEKEHHTDVAIRKGYTFDEYGNLVSS